MREGVIDGADAVVMALAVALAVAVKRGVGLMARRVVMAVSDWVRVVVVMFVGEWSLRENRVGRAGGSSNACPVLSAPRC